MNTPHAITVLAPGFEETEVVTIIDLLRRGGIAVTVLGLESREVTGSHRITVLAEGLLADFADDFDAIVLPGGQPGAANLASSPRLLELIRATFRRGGLCAAVCAGPTVLGAAGILAGYRATCYPGNEGALLGATVVEEPVVRDRTIITSRGVGTAIPFALEIIGYLESFEKAEQVREAILYPPMR
jgi:4-methyl-5(b-hydroxyethyl)-thiazole monophosphate biosynthesis